MDLLQYSDGGFFSPRKIADTFRTTSEELAQTAGLRKDAVQRKERIRSDKTQRRLRETIEIINKAEPRFGSALIAYAWYRSEPLPGFSGQTAMQLVRNGRASEVLDYIDAVDAGASTPDPAYALPRPRSRSQHLYLRHPICAQSSLKQDRD